MPRYSHIVWDWNGTLLDDAGLCVEIMNELLRRRGLPPITMDFYRAAIEFPVAAYYEKLGFDFTAESFERVSGEFVSLYQAGWRDCPLQEGAQVALVEFKAAGVGQSVLSASRSDYLEEQLEYFGIRGLLCAVTGADNHHGRGKLHIAKEHLSALGLDPERVLFIGDTQHDAEVAEEAGCACLLVSFGHYNTERLSFLGLPVAQDFNGILDFQASLHRI